MEFFYIAIIAMAGSFLQTSSGIGYAILTMALWPMFLPFKTASIVQVITAFAMIIYIAAKLYKHINFKLLIYPLISSLAFSTFGVMTLMASTETFMRRILGITLMILSVYFVIVSKKIKVKPTRMNGLVAGAVSGFLSGLFNVGGPPIVAYFISVTDDKMEYNGTLHCYYIFTTIYIFIMHVVMGNLSTEVLKFSLFGLIGVLAGTGGGMVLFRKMSIEAIRKLVYVFMVAAGLYLTVKG